MSDFSNPATTLRIRLGPFTRSSSKNAQSCRNWGSADCSTPPVRMGWRRVRRRENGRDAAGLGNGTLDQRLQCPLWVKSGHSPTSAMEKAPPRIEPVSTDEESGSIGYPVPQSPKVSISLRAKNQSLLNQTGLELSASRIWEIKNGGAETGRGIAPLPGAKNGQFSLLRNRRAPKPRKVREEILLIAHALRSRDWLAGLEGIEPRSVVFEPVSWVRDYRESAHGGSILTWCQNRVSARIEPVSS